jgi:hypothetical protein
MVIKRYCLPWTPSLHNACKKDLFLIVSDIRPDTVDSPIIMAIEALYDLWSDHSRFEITKNFCKR